MNQNPEKNRRLFDKEMETTIKLHVFKKISVSRASYPNVGFAFCNGFAYNIGQISADNDWCQSGLNQSRNSE